MNLGFPSMEYRGQLGPYSYYRDRFGYKGKGRVITTKNIYLDMGNVILRINLKLPKGYVLVEPVRLIDVQMGGPFFSYRENPEQYEKSKRQTREIMEESYDYQSYLQDKSAFDTLPDLENLKTNGLPINIPMATSFGEGVVYVCVAFYMRFIGDNDCGKVGKSSVFTGPFNPITRLKGSNGNRRRLPLFSNEELLPLNYQTGHTYLWDRGTLLPSMMLFEEVEDLWKKTISNFDWERQGSQANPFKSLLMKNEDPSANNTGVNDEYEGGGWMLPANDKLIVFDNIHLVIPVTIHENCPLIADVVVEANANPATVAHHEHRRQYIPCQDSFQGDIWKFNQFDEDDFRP